MQLEKSMDTGKWLTKTSKKKGRIKSDHETQEAQIIFNWLSSALSARACMRIFCLPEVPNT